MNNKIQLKSTKTFGLTLVSFAVLSTLTACNQIDRKEEKNNTEQDKAELILEDIAQNEVAADYELSNNAKLNNKAQVRTLPKQLSVADMSTISIMEQAIPNHPIDTSTIIEDRENYLKSTSNPVKQVHVEPVSTFSIDVDTGSYSNVRRFINNGNLPPKDAVREEAFLNYFNYDYSTPEDASQPFKVHSEVANAPWNEQRQLVKIGIKGFEVTRAELKDANLVFLLDVSGSMGAPHKLPLLKSSLTMLTKQLDESDSVAIVVYAGAAGVVLPATAGNDHAAITNALTQLNAGGSTNGAQGIELAYQIAQKNFKKGGVNRVILATDGDFNVGTQSIDELKDIIAKKRETGIALTTLGFGQGNYNDGLMEQLANIGNGQHAYIDTINEARKILVDELSSSMQIIAKDVKIQVEFNPQLVSEYRLIGYQNRILANEDFNNDKVDAAELGAGHSVTALYEITMVNAKNKQIDDLRYPQNSQNTDKIFTINNDELAYVKVRYKKPDSDISELISQAIVGPFDNHIEPSQDFKFAASVAGFAQLLKGGKYTGDWTYQDSANLASENKGADLFGYRAEFIQLVRTADALK